MEMRLAKDAIAGFLSSFSNINPYKGGGGGRLGMGETGGISLLGASGGLLLSAGGISLLGAKGGEGFASAELG